MIYFEMYKGIPEESCNGKVISMKDCMYIDANTKSCASYATVLPISDKEYREKNPTQAKAFIHIGKDFTTFNIFDDWGKPHSLTFSNDEIDTIDRVKTYLLIENLLR